MIFLFDTVVKETQRHNKIYSEYVPFKNSNKSQRDKKSGSQDLEEHLIREATQMVNKIIEGTQSHYHQENAN